MKLVFEKMSELFQVEKEKYEGKNLLRHLETKKVIGENEIDVNVETKMDTGEIDFDVDNKENFPKISQAYSALKSATDGKKSSAVLKSIE